MRFNSSRSALSSARNADPRGISPATGHRHPVVLGELGEKAEVLGAVALAMNQAAEALDDGAVIASALG